MELDTADHRRSSGVTSGLHRMLCELGEVWIFALKPPRHPHLVTVLACGGHEQRVRADRRVF